MCCLPPTPRQGLWFPNGLSLLMAPLLDPSSSIRLWWLYFTSCPFRAPGASSALIVPSILSMP